MSSPQTRVGRMSTRASESVPQGASQSKRLGLAIGWLVLFSIWFYSFGLPNHRPAERWMVWQRLPFDLLDLIDPPEIPNAPPWNVAYLGQRIPYLAIACAVWLAAVAIGRLILRILRVRSLFESIERFFLAGCLGLAACSLLMLGLGLSGLMQTWLLAALMLAACGTELWLTRRELTPTGMRIAKSQGANEKASGSSLLYSRLIIAIAAPFVFCMLLGALSPQTDFDVLEYHLGGPKEWFLQGRITRLPHNVYTSFPFLTEMLVLCGMVLTGDWEWGALSGQAIVAGFIPLTAIGLYATGRRWFSGSAGLLASLVWLTTPWAYRIAIIAYAEGGLACYLFASLAVVMRVIWFRDQRQKVPESPVTDSKTATPPSGLFALAGLLSGCAMACKYTGLVSAVIPLALVLAWRSIRTTDTAGLRARLVPLGLFAAGVLCAIGPWLVKNAIETGNPVFPLAYSLFGGEGRDAIMDAQWRAGHSSHYARAIDRLWDLPVKLTDVVANNDWHSALMFGLAPIALLASWRRKVWFVWAIIGWQFFTWFLFTHHIDRFYVPLLPIVALLAGCAAGWMSQFPGALWISIPVFTASILFNAWIMQHVSGFNAGRTDLRAARDMVMSPSLKWLNDEYEQGRLPKDFKVLSVGEAALFFARFPYRYNTVFDRSLFEQWCAEKSPSGEFQLRPADEIRATLRRQGITHVFVNWAEILRYREPGSYGYTDFALPHWFQRLQEAGVLAEPLVLPAQVSVIPVSESQRGQAAEWAPQLLLQAGETPALQAVQIYPVR